MKYSKKSLIASVALLAAVPMANAEVSGNVTVATDYIWRGISQTQNNGAIQGGFDYEHASGAYVGIWGSSVDFDSDDNNVNDASLELDYYAGYGFSLTKDIDMDLGVIKYTYPDASDLNFTEGYIGVSGWGFSLGYAGTGSITADESGDYWTAGYETELNHGISLSLGYGYWDLKDGDAFGDEDSYSNWLVSVSKNFAGVDVALTYTDTDLGDSDCVAFAGDKDYCDSNFVLSISKSL